ncbi:MAG: sulfatase-like hydrolase/transferase [Polyangiaceae bacterium]
MTAGFSRRLETALGDVAAVAAAWAGLLLAENVVVGFLWRQQFSGAWEISLSRHTIVPIALVTFAPLSLAVVALWAAARKAADGAIGARWAVAVTGAIAGAAIALGVTGGRHFENWWVRSAFIAVLGASGGLISERVAPRLTRLARRPLLLAAFGILLTAGAWISDSFLLHRLYVGFHIAMFAASLLGAALVGIAFRVDSDPGWTGRVLTLLVGALVAACAGWAPRAAEMLDRAANLRIALVEHAPLLGRALVVEGRWHSAVDDGHSSDTLAIAPGEVARSLDWSGHDLVLLTVDALRADHVSAYGYSRRTTPNIDALAREGTLFEHAYCPIPNTSYSIGSMLTGKYLRPLLEVGLGEDSETWSQSLRRYGWRTAAFYPPAVFFIDENRFTRFERDHLGFEYTKVEFADPVLRERQVTEYLNREAPEAPLFLWVHFFEPHEPYVVHEDHVFAGGESPDVDAYDSEVAAADDGIGRITRLIRARRPGAVIVVTADHGEEFGEHGGHYHGTTVYEEQVRVPMVVTGPGVRRGQRIETVVQTIDLLPTALSALGIPRPVRLRGRDLGSHLAGKADGDPGFAFAETDDYALVASGEDRLVCQRRAAACAQFRPKDDPGEHHDLAGDQAARFEVLRAMLRSVERDHGRYELSAGPAWPEAIRRGLQGDGDVATDAASLLDDADVVVRRKAAEVCFRLHVPATIEATKRSFARDEDEEVRRWSALALARTGEPIASLVDSLLKDPDREWRDSAALALGERGEGRACDELASWWRDLLPPPGADGGPPGVPFRVSLALADAEQLVAATGKARCRSAVPALLRALDDVRIRPIVADALGEIGDERARERLLALFQTEPYVTARPHEARALLALGTRAWAAPGGPAPSLDTTLFFPPAATSPLKLLVLVSDAGAALDVRINDTQLQPGLAGTDVRVFDFSSLGSRRLRLRLRTSSGGVIALWLASAERLD